MTRFSVVALLSLWVTTSFSQTCTLSGGPINWNNASPPTCNEGGDASGKSIIIIPAGVNLSFNSNGDTWTGTKIQVYGTLDIDFSVTINSSIEVFNGGLVNLKAKLNLGPTTAGCGYTMAIYSGGTVDVGGTGSDRLTICNTELMKGNGSCNSCLGTNSGTCAYNGSPYCEPTNGFQGPLGYAEGGYDGALPVNLLYFTATVGDQEVLLDWATSAEEDFDRFVIERSQTGLDFEPLGEMQGVGRNIYDVKSTYKYVDSEPLLGFNYYRLKALDLDGAYEYSGVRVVKLSGPKQISVYPNPTSGNSVRFDINFNPSEDDQVLLVNNLGVELLRQPVKNFGNELIFDDNLSPGLYLLKYLSHDFEKITRVMVSQ